MTEAETGVTGSQAGNARDCHQHPKLRGRHTTEPPWSPQRGTALLAPGCHTAGAQNSKRIHFCCVRPPSLGNCVPAAPGGNSRPFLLCLDPEPPRGLSAGSPGAVNRSLADACPQPLRRARGKSSLVTHRARVRLVSTTEHFQQGYGFSKDAISTTRSAVTLQKVL